MAYGQPPGPYNQPYGQQIPPTQPPYGMQPPGGTQQQLPPPMQQQPMPPPMQQQPMPPPMQQQPMPPPMQQQPMPPPIPQQHYPTPMPPPIPPQPQFPPPENLQIYDQTEYELPEYPRERRFSFSAGGIGKNIGFGLLFYVIVAVACGLGVFISILASGKDGGDYGVFSGLMAIMMGPAFALVIGIIQGKLADSDGEAMISGGVANVVGYLILMFIIIGFLAAAISIKYPSTDSDEEDEEDSVSVNYSELIIQFVGILLPSGVIGALGAFFSERFIFE